MEQLTQRLTDTATILSNIPRMLDLADERELRMLAALVQCYVDCKGPDNWQTCPGYLEAVALAALINEGDAITEDDVATQEYGVVDSALDYVRMAKRSGAEGDYWDDERLASSALGFACYGEPIDGKVVGGETKPCSMRRAFELAIAEADAEAKASDARRKAEEEQRKAAEKSEAEAAENQRIKKLRSKAPAKLTPDERTWRIKDEENSMGALRQMAQHLRARQSSVSRELRELRRPGKADVARRSERKQKRAATPIDSKRKARAKRSKVTRKAA